MALVVLGTGVTGAGLLVGLGLLGQVGIVAAAVAGAALVLGLVLFVGRRVQHTMTLLILGLMFGYLTSAVVSVLLYFSIPEQVQTYVLWTFGSFGAVAWGQLTFLAPIVLAGLVLASLLVKPLNALLLGETYARSMGLGARRARLWIIASAALLAGAVTAYCGPIGFLGVAVPHLCRALFNTSDHRVLLPASVLLGGILALSCGSSGPFARQRGHPAAQRGHCLDRRARGHLDHLAPPHAAAGLCRLNAVAATILQTRDLCIGYAPKRRPRVDVAADIGVELFKGELVCLLGPNGAGKSTLMRTLAGLQKPLAGEVLLQDRDLHGLTESERARLLGLVLTERVDVGNLSAYALVALGRYPYTGWDGRLSAADEEVVRWAIDAVGARELGGAQRRRTERWRTAKGDDCPRFGAGTSGAPPRRAYGLFGFAAARRNRAVVAALGRR